MIDTLIDKQDNFEIIDLQIATILAAESVNQVALATTDGKPNPDDWKLRVFLEASNPWEQFLNDDTDRSPIINVWYDNSNFDGGAGDTVQRQQANGIFNIDCIGYGKAKDEAVGHEPGDKAAALEAHRALRLVRNILFAAEYTYLDLQKLVGARWPQSITVFQPQQGENSVQNVVGARLALRVTYNETSPQITGEILETVKVDVKRTEDGEIVIEAQYDSTP